MRTSVSTVRVVTRTNASQSELEAKYTGRVDFSLINSEVDPLFNVDKAEAWPAGPIERAQSFIRWIGSGQRSE